MPTRKAADLRPGDLIDIEDVTDPDDPNYSIALFAYVEVEQVGGGWLDNAAGDGEVVIYLEGAATPAIVRADHVFEVQP